MSDRDARLAARCAAGDRRALRELYDRFADKVWRYGLLRTGSRDAAADIVQDTFVRVLRAAGGFEGRSSLGTWIYAIARSAAIDFVRRERRDRRLADSPRVFRLVPPLVELEDTMSPEQEREEVRRAVAELPPAMRDAIVLCELGDMKISEAAEVLGWGESRVKVTLFRARRRLRDKMLGNAETRRRGNADTKKASGPRP